MIKIICKNCKKDFLTYPKKVENGGKKFCSKKCYSKSQVTKVVSQCIACSKTFLSFLSRSKYGRGKYCSSECQYKMQSAEKCPLWKGGVTPINKQIRTSKEYKDWRISVFKRDNYTCKNCKSYGVILHADHIKPFAFFPELRFSTENGRTLCVPCHKKTDTYGHKIFKTFNKEILCQ